MNLPELDHYDYHHLKEIRDRCHQLMSQKKSEEISRIRAELQARAEALEITAHQILDVADVDHAKKRATGWSSIPKYRDPLSGAEWSGKGRGVPDWMRAAIRTGGKKKDEFLNPDWLAARRNQLTLPRPLPSL